MGKKIEEALRHYEHGYADGIEWAMTNHKVVCSRCGGSGWMDAIGPKDDGSYITSRPCPQCDVVSLR